MSLFKERLLDPTPILADGAKGTELSHFIEEGHSTDELNIRNPSVVSKLHHEYIDAGAQIIGTNTFLANLALNPNPNFNTYREIETMNVNGAVLAKVAAQKTGAVVAGVIGPSAHILHPEEKGYAHRLERALLPQITGLIDGGVDCIHLETQYNLHEVILTAELIRAIAPYMPIMVSMTFQFDSIGGLVSPFSGATPVELQAIAREYGFAAYGANCGLGLNQAGAVLEQFSERENDWLIMKLNTGLPVKTTQGVQYNHSLTDVNRYGEMKDLQRVIIGMCCGSTPRDIEHLSRVMTDLKNV